MPIQVLMPALSPTMEKGNLAKWIKSEGDKIKSGDIIAEIETDKATMEVEATDEGTLGKILIPEGTADVAVNTPIAVILSDGEDASVNQDGESRPDRPPSQQRVEESRSPVGEGVPQINAPSIAAPKLRARGRSGSSRRHRNGDHDRARSVARRHGGGNAPRPGRVRDGRGGRRISGRLQGHAGVAAGIRCRARHRYADHRAWLCRHGRRCRACRD